MKPGQTLFDVTCDVLLRLKAVLEEERPDVVLVHGDTTTSFAAALACFYLQIPVGHVEAGLRTRDIYSPWPEEFNRQAVDIVSGYYFAPTEASRRNLLDEGKPAQRIWVTGNTGIDALATTVREGYSHPELEWARGSRLILVTAHRRENLGEPMHRMFRAIRRVMEEHPDTKAIYPIHMNPLVRKAAHEELDGFDRLRIVEPLKVLDFHNFMAASHLILTDSGGIQEEAPGLGKPVLVMRDTTERPEGVEAGTLKLVGTDEDVIYREFSRLLSDADEYARMIRRLEPLRRRSRERADCGRAGGPVAMIRVLHIIQQLGPGRGGVRTFVSTMLDCPASDIEQSVLSVGRVEGDRFGERFFGPLIDSYSPLLVGTLGAKRLGAFLSKRRFDIVQIHTNNALGFVFASEAKKAGVPARIVHCHNSALGSTSRLKNMVNVAMIERFLPGGE